MPRTGFVRLEFNSAGSNQPFIRNTGGNGEPLSHSESFASDREGAINNIASHVRLFGGTKVQVREFINGREVDRFYVLADGGVSPVEDGEEEE